ncbi:hypothetical protein M23134_05035 [Microscilla marina ATCC 23134]|uniref:Uncharacterized protein n=1 Tax=Microscilla marina ATCC 23134 TaxID=313606 RepID=A1ZCZ0_MICM2|nr:hypothetical protein M23134_05035 [Microscilla marina ATCC 23134]
MSELHFWRKRPSPRRKIGILKLVPFFEEASCPEEKSGF